ncbi:MAG TPA: FAD-dependent monooxygenase [Methylomirabilota bacterium]|nr:FAD-dependent monooxygenase [Methylomirabilota bacterium]
MEGQPITIIGGGLAGLTLALLLRKAEVPVTVLEAGAYPRHRVCGEFISGPGQPILEQLGLLPTLEKAGLRHAQSVSFHTTAHRWTSRLRHPGWVVPRHALDAVLANAVKNAGAELRTHARAMLKDAGPGEVLACGHARATLSEEGGLAWRYVGVKVHARNLPLRADLEMHCGPPGYFGLCDLGDGRVNICALLRSRTTFPKLGTGWRDILESIASSDLAGRLKNMVVDEDSFCATAGMDYRGSATVPGELRIGDSRELIAPVTGNGMSLAIESASCVAPFVAAYARGELTWKRAVARANSELRRRFRRRTAVARALQSILFSHSPIQRQLVRLGSREPVWRWLIQATRS